MSQPTSWYVGATPGSRGDPSHPYSHHAYSVFTPFGHNTPISEAHRRDESKKKLPSQIVAARRGAPRKAIGSRCPTRDERRRPRGRPGSAQRGGDTSDLMYHHPTPLVPTCSGRRGHVRRTNPWVTASPAPNLRSTRPYSRLTPRRRRRWRWGAAEHRAPPSPRQWQGTRRARPLWRRAACPRR